LHGAVISQDGKYAFTKQYLDDGTFYVILHRVTNASLVELWRLPADRYSVVTWFQEDEARLLVMTPGQSGNPDSPGPATVTIYNPPDQSILSAFNVYSGVYTGVDPETGLIGFWDYWPGTDDKKKLILMDYQTGQIRTEIFLAPRIDQLVLYKSHILSSQGYYLNVDEFL
jgi:hypothetical protein